MWVPATPTLSLSSTTVKFKYPTPPRQVRMKVLLCDGPSSLLKRLIHFFYYLCFQIFCRRALHYLRSIAKEHSLQLDTITQILTSNPNMVQSLDDEEDDFAYQIFSLSNLTKS